jgi:hypothetical protein
MRKSSNKPVILFTRWRKLFGQGVYTTVRELGDAENISKSYVSRILRLALLAPDIIELILEGRSDHALMLKQLERPLPASWKEQRLLLPTSCQPLARHLLGMS